MSGTGVLADRAIRAMVAAGAIAADPAVTDAQVQPASLDLRLGAVAYRVRASFLAGKGRRVVERIAEFEMHRIDLRLTGRVASDRPRGLRVVHAASCELSTLVVTLPILVWIGGHCLGAALAVDLGLTVGYTVYAYGFFVFYDWWRPVRLRPARGRIR